VEDPDDVVVDNEEEDVESDVVGVVVLVVVVDELATVNVVLVLLFAVLVSLPFIVALAIIVYVPGRVGAVRVVETVPEAPGDSVPRSKLASRAVVAAVAIEIVTTTDLAVLPPRLPTVSLSPVVTPLLRVALPSVGALGAMSALSGGAASSDPNSKARTPVAAVGSVQRARGQREGIERSPLGLLSGRRTRPLFFGSPAIRL
jgi:hypothetical protein